MARYKFSLLYLAVVNPEVLVYRRVHRTETMQLSHVTP